MPIFPRHFGSAQEPITLEDFDALRAEEPRRLCFGRAKKLSRGTSGPAVGFLNVNFRESIGPLLPWDLERYESKYGRQFRRVIRSEMEFEAIEKWIADNLDVVFIRSLLDVCIAASLHQSEPGIHTVIGDLERRAKYEFGRNGRVTLLEVLESVYIRLLRDKRIDCICAVPPSSSGQFCLPAWLASGLSHRLEIEDISPSLHWAGPKPKMKEVDVDQKWEKLEAVGLTVPDSVKGRRILILDDLYQSGTTVHFVASKLQAAGAVELSCLAVVSQVSRDTDNL